MNESETTEARGAQSDEEAGAAPPSSDLYEEELRRYRMALNRGVDHACRRYGFVLYHSLSGNEVVELRKKLGFAPVEATDFHNLGVVSAENADFAEAVECFRGALQADPGLADAEYNLALALEQSGDTAAAKKQWAAYLKREGLNEADRQSISQHVKELG